MRGDLPYRIKCARLIALVFHSDGTQRFRKTLRVVLNATSPMPEWKGGERSQNFRSRHGVRRLAFGQIPRGELRFKVFVNDPKMIV